MQAEQNENIKKLIQNTTGNPTPRAVQQEELDSSFESQPDSTDYRTEEEVAIAESSPGPDKRNDREDLLRAKIAEAQRELAEMKGAELMFDFTPTTMCECEWPCRQIFSSMGV